MDERKFFCIGALITENLELRYMELSSGHNNNTVLLTPDDKFKCLAFLFSYIFSSIKAMNLQQICFNHYISSTCSRL